MEYVAHGELLQLAAKEHERTGADYQVCVQRMLRCRPGLARLATPAHGADPVQALVRKTAALVKGGLRQDEAISRARAENPVLALAVSREMVHPHTREAAQSRWREAMARELDSKFSPSPISQSKPTVKDKPGAPIGWRQVQIFRTGQAVVPIREEQERLRILGLLMRGAEPERLGVYLADYSSNPVTVGQIDWNFLGQALVARGLASASSV